MIFSLLIRKIKTPIKAISFGYKMLINISSNINNDKSIIPNPNTLKFIPGVKVLEEGTVEFKDNETAKISNLANLIFLIKGIEGVFLATGLTPSGISVRAVLTEQLNFQNDW